MMLNKTNEPHKCGVVELENNIVKNFYEKVLNPPQKPTINNNLQIEELIIFSEINRINNPIIKQLRKLDKIVAKGNLELTF